MIALFEAMIGSTIRPELLWVVEVIAIAFATVLIIKIINVLFFWKSR